MKYRVYTNGDDFCLTISDNAYLNYKNLNEHKLYTHTNMNYLKNLIPKIIMIILF